jgi:precorrin-2 dehydrogenase / sirohydrochlorin ferrochelatase
VSGYPVLLEGRAISALVIGGGRVALRKARALLATGATVRVVAPAIIDELQALRERESRLTIERRGFEDDDIRYATLVIAATDDRATNARVAQVARQQHRLVSVADLPAEGNFVGMATHRSGDVVIGVSAGGVPRAAARIRDTIAERFDIRYASAIAVLRTLRRRLLDAGGATKWELAMNRLLDEGFCARVESGALAAEADAWR